MRSLLPAVVCSALFLCVAGAATAALVDPTLIPDGTYVVLVEKVVDSAHIVVKMDNGMETTFAADGVDFGDVKPDQKLKISVVRGKIPVFRVAS
jgi:hypothetical protein